jgi:hypothetical protein
MKILAPLGTGMVVGMSIVGLEFRALQRQFEDESSKSDRFWMDPDSIRGFYNGVARITIAISLLLLVLGAAIAFAGAENPIVLGFGAGVMAAMLVSVFMTLPVVKLSIDNQERVLGYIYP